MSHRGSRVARRLADDDGAAAVEFVLVGLMLTVVTLAVLQLGLGIYVRNVVHDAAVDGAFHGALADTAPGDGAARAREVITRTVGSDYARDVTAREVEAGSGAVVEVTVRTILPLIGLLGFAGGVEVTAHAPVESLD